MENRYLEPDYEYSTECEHCRGEIYENYDIYWIDGEAWCEKCIDECKEYFEPCDTEPTLFCECGEELEEGDEFYRIKGEILCKKCFEELVDVEQYEPDKSW